MAESAPRGRPTRTGPGGPAHRVRLVQVAGFPLAPDLLYQPETHMWVLLTGTTRARIGMDSLGIETSGTLAELSLPPVRTELAAGRPFGQLEAAKFVGPLISPVSGTVLAVNEAVAADPGLAEREPYSAGWLVEAQLTSSAEELPGLLGGAEEVTRWFAAAVDDYRREGVIAQ